uniref:G_PROTEIN_RECEP_F2_3 domain-containing protein n=1 Tax=Ascaris lumbricoides TaxID=6252 RepID=A0A0M3HFA2_ASCLU
MFNLFRNNTPENVNMQQCLELQMIADASEDWWPSNDSEESISLCSQDLGNPWSHAYKGKECYIDAFEELK